MMKRMMLGLALVAAAAVGSLATANSAEAGNCYRGGWGGFYAPSPGETVDRYAIGRHLVGGENHIDYGWNRFCRSKLNQTTPTTRT